MSFEEIFNEVGDFGRYQALLVFACIWSMIPFACNISAVIFLGYEESHGCAVPPGSESQILPNVNWSTSTSLPTLSIPVQEFRSCSMNILKNASDLEIQNPALFNNNTSITLPCHNGYIHNRKVFQETIRTEWDLVCANNYLNSAATALFCLGMLIGSLFGGSIADRYGRISTMIGGTAMNVILGISCSFSPNFIAFLIFRSFIGVFSVVVQIAMATYTVEIVGQRYRAWIGLLVGVFSGVGYMTLSLIAYFFRSWRTIQLVLGIIYIPFLIIAPFVPESPRLLVTQGKLRKARSICERIALNNGRHLAEDTWNKLEEELELCQRKKSFAFFEIFKNCRLVVLLLKSITLWFVNGLIFFCLSFNVGHWSGNPFLNSALSGLVEMVACLLIVPVINKIGRRNTVIVSLTIAGMAISMAEISKLIWESSKGSGIAEVILLLIAKFTISGSFNLLFLYTAELFPTATRNTALGISTAGGRTASIVAPFVLEIQHFQSWILSVVLAVIAFVSAMITLKCPETKGVAMFSTTEEALQHYKRKNTKLLLNNNNNNNDECASTKPCGATLPLENISNKYAL